jgi:hypothetical protein
LEIGGYGVYQDESKALVVGCGWFYEKEEMKATGRNPILIHDGDLPPHECLEG